MTPKIEILDQKFAHFGRFQGSFSTIFGVKKVVFSTFSKLFSNRLESLKAWFLALQGLLLAVFSAPTVDKKAPKKKIDQKFAHFGGFEVNFDQKSQCSGSFLSPKSRQYT